MTDDQLQSLFAGMERRLDKRAEQTEQRILGEVNTRIGEVNAKIEALETKLLGEFWKWARGVEARMRNL
jgi:hypothetical protein